MSNPTRILFVAGEATPFAEVTDMAKLVRTLPEHLQEAGNYETRIMMPRYGTISERRSRLHEVIRLSGTEVPMGDEVETLKVKVASIPGVRLQVYFMDSVKYFKRKGIFADKQGKTFEDNAARALFFARATLATIRKLGWGPDVVHAFGSMSAFVPMLLRTEYGEDELLKKAKVIYTPNDVDLDAELTSDFAEAMNLDAGGPLEPTMTALGLAYTDAAIYPPTLTPPADEAQFDTEPEEMVEQASALYDQMLSEVPA